MTFSMPNRVETVINDPGAFGSTVKTIIHHIAAIKEKIVGKTYSRYTNALSPFWRILIVSNCRSRMERLHRAPLRPSTRAGRQARIRQRSLRVLYVEVQPGSNLEAMNNYSVPVAGYGSPTINTMKPGEIKNAELSQQSPTYSHSCETESR